MRKEAVYYRKTDIKKFEDFKDGDCICEVCNGWGYFYDCFDNKVSQCYHCKGEGKLDWVTNATGVVGRSGTTGGAGLSSSSFHNAMGSGSSGYGRPQPPKGQSSGSVLRPIKPPPSPSPSPLRGLGFPPPPQKRIIPRKVVKKIPWKERFMNTVADK